MPLRDPKHIKYFARTNFRKTHQAFGIRYPEDWQYHTTIIGKTGSGKSNLLKSFMLNTMLHGNHQGFCLIDPHGELCEFINGHVPEERRKDVVYVNLTDPKLKLGYNPLKKTSGSKRGLVASAILDILEGFGGTKDWGSKLSFILLNCIMALLEYPGQTNMGDVVRLLRDKPFRDKVVIHVRNTEVKQFFEKQFKDFSPKYDFLPVYNKFRFLIHGSIQRLLVENSDCISLREIMDGSKILLINCAKGSVGADASKLIGSLFLSQLAASGFSRIDKMETNRVPFTIYIDEAQLFASNSSSNIAGMLEELRKMKVYTVLSFQGMGSLDTGIRERIFSNVGNLLVFRTSAVDGSFLSNEMAKYLHPFTYRDFVTLPKYHMVVRMMIDGQPSKPFTATSLDYLANL